MAADASRLRIVVLGYIVRGPVGGLAWHHLNYVLGLKTLGHDVWFVEDSDDYPGCYDPRTEAMGTDASYGLAFIADAFERAGIGPRWAYHDAHRGAWEGPAAARVDELGRTADLLLDVSGINPLRAWTESIPCRVLVDTDPVFTQLRHLEDEEARARARQHTAFFTFGENIGRPGCTVPDDGLPWRPTRQPVVLDAWPAGPGPERGPLTTVMQWDSYPAREHEGRRYGMKSESLRPYLDLPGRTGRAFELVLGGRDAPRELLAEKGWSVRHPREPSRDPWTYQGYIRASKAEFSVAKHGYVASRSGWFSERSANYLASGRPVVVQDTGFSEWLDADGGVLPFRDPGEAAARIEELDAAYARQCEAARAAAERYFDARRVLPPLIEQALAGKGGGAP